MTHTNTQGHNLTSLSPKPMNNLPTPDMLLLDDRPDKVVTTMNRAMELNAQGIVTYVLIDGFAIRPTYEAARRFAALGNKSNLHL